MHLGFHIYDVGFQSPNVEAARPLVYATALLLVMVIALLNFSAIAIPTSAAALPIGVYLPAIFTRDFGISLGTIGLIFLLGRLWDAFTDPLVGALSDRTRTRFGRRKPWIAAGGALFLVAALGLGFAGGSFAVGVSYVSSWFERERQGTALGVFGAGTIGTAMTTFGAPLLVNAFGWRETVQIYAAVLAAAAVLFYLLTREDPASAARAAGMVRSRRLADQLSPLTRLQVWRFSLYYFFVFGAFVALASWLPRYYMGMYGLPLAEAGLLTTAYALPAAAFRALGGWISDRIGARTVMYLTFIVSSLACFVLSYPATDYVVHGIEGPIAFSFEIGLPAFVSLTVVLGFFMAVGMAAVYKHIPVYYPDHVGAVGGLVGAIGGLGGFFLPITFGVMNDLIGVWTSCFMLLFALVAMALIWMHGAIRLMEREKIGALRTLPELPEMAELHKLRNAASGRAT
ncbi:MAG: MFS transporter, partial [Alphaproteobacteria bacterium]|nr:MFS transporter [Alphaproteobacteria bacterium]